VEGLTTGWEPDRPHQDSVVRQFVYSYADRTAEMARALGGRTERGVDAALADLGSAFAYDNAVVLLRPPTRDGLVALVDRAFGFYPPDRSWVLLSVWPLDAVDPGLAARGLTPVGHPPLLVRSPGGTAPPPPPDLRILPVTTASDLTVFQKVPAVLLASDAGRPVHGRLGFVRLLRCTMWRRPGAVAA
jgi:hypothetical protein